MTDDELLRAASERLHGLVGAATSGPWTLGAATVFDGSGIKNGLHEVALSPDDGRDNPDLAYIAAMNPVVGLAVAEWLASEFASPHLHWWDANRMQRALAVAQAVMGEEA